MAASSSSTLNGKCFYCKTPCSQYKQGWRLRNGNYAALCNRCSSAYEDGSFCYIFHDKDEGWRNCEICNGRIHCGCVMSEHMHMILDFGGVRCMECSDIDLPVERHQHLAFNTTPENSRHLKDPSKAILGPPFTQSLLHSHASSADGRDGVSADHLGGDSSPGDYPDLQQIIRDPNSVVVPLFEKKLTNSDTNRTNGRLVLPTKCAEAHFPKIHRQKGVPILIQDTRGNEWEIYFRFWNNNSGRMYVSEGLKDIMITMQWRAGDTVKFYRIEPEGKMVLGFHSSRTTHAEN